MLESYADNVLLRIGLKLRRLLKLKERARRINNNENSKKKKGLWLLVADPDYEGIGPSGLSN